MFYCRIFTPVGVRPELRGRGWALVTSTLTPGLGLATRDLDPAIAALMGV